MISVVTVMGTRPEGVKLAPVVLALRRRSSEFDARIWSTGQHRHMLTQVLADFGLDPDVDLDVMQADQHPSGVAAAVLKAIHDKLVEERPDVILVQGDTTSAMSAALAAYHLRIPVAHVEAGLRTGDRYRPFPEEINRQIIGRLASFHYAPTRTAVKALQDEGLDPATIVLTGNTVVDALQLIASHQTPDYPPSGLRRVLVTAHRRESFGKPFEEICSALRSLVERNPDIQILYPVHLNPKVREPVTKYLLGVDRIVLREPASYREMVALLAGCTLVLTDSGGIQEEAPVFGKPVLVLRDITERPEGVAAGSAKVVGTRQEVIVEATERLLNDPAEYNSMASAQSPYGDGHAAERIADHLSAVSGELKSLPVSPA